MKNFTFLVAILFFISVGSSSAKKSSLLNPSGDAKPQIQVHTTRADIAGVALLSPIGQNKITGTVEFQKVPPDRVKTLVTLANGTVGATYDLFLSTAKRCEDLRDSPSDPKLLKEIGSVKIEEGGMGQATFTGEAQEAVERDYILRALLVRISPDDARTHQAWVGCGVVDKQVLPQPPLGPFR